MMSDEDSDNCIERIEHAARALKRDSDDLRRQLHIMQRWPDYRTRAEAMLDDIRYIISITDASIAAALAKAAAERARPVEVA